MEGRQTVRPRVHKILAIIAGPCGERLWDLMAGVLEAQVPPMLRFPVPYYPTATRRSTSAHYAPSRPSPCSGTEEIAKG
eukprot:gene2894-3481_t